MMIHFFFLLLLSLMGAVPSAAYHLSGSDIARRVVSPGELAPTSVSCASASVVSAVPAPTCTYGTPASKQKPSEFPIERYTKVLPTMNDTSYEVDKKWEGDHFISGPHYLGYGHRTDPEAAFMCQYKCNSEETCQSYFVTYVEINTTYEHADCTLYSGLIQDVVLLPSPNTTIAGGAYDKLCD